MQCCERWQSTTRKGGTPSSLTTVSVPQSSTTCARPAPLRGEAIANVAYGYQLGDRELLPEERFSGGESAANAALRALGFEIVNTRPKNLEDERTWRLAV
jgi:hypothetical protein